MNYRVRLVKTWFISKLVETFVYPRLESYPDWIESGQYTRIRIKQGKTDPKRNEKSSSFEELNVLSDAPEACIESNILVACW